MLASLATIMKEKTALVTSMVYFALTINLAHVDGIQDKCAQVKGELLQISRPRHNAFLQDLTKYWGEN